MAAQNGSVTIELRHPAVEEHRGRRRWQAGAGIALLFLVAPAVSIAQSTSSWPLRALGLVTLAVFAALYLWGIPAVFGAARPGQLAVPLLMFAISWVLLPVLGPDFGTLWTFVAVAFASLLPMSRSLPVAVALAAGMVGLDLLYGQDPSWELAFTVVALSLWMTGFMANVNTNRQLREARSELAELAVAQERQRSARDLHDSLGHSLTAISLKASLARKLVDRDPTAAIAEITEVERMSRDALADIRSTTAGMRDVSLAGELAIAGSVLRSAGVAAALPTAVDDVAAEGREVFGFVLREAVTNVVRHARATRCTVTVTPRSVEIVDNGRGSAADAGNGLAGLAERVAAVGGRLISGPAPGGGFRVRAELAEEVV